MKLVIFIPMVNEVDTIVPLINRIPKKIEGIDEIDICVRDEGVTPGLAELAESAGAIAYRNRERKGIAFAFKEIVQFALERGADVLVNIDADLQFKPEDIPTLAGPVIRGEADFAASDRFIDAKTGKVRRPKNMPIGKYLGNVVGAKIVGMLSGKKFDDVTCGFRAYNREVLLSLNLNSKQTYTQESFQSIAVNKFVIKTLPVEVKYGKDIRPSTVVTSFHKFLFGSALNILRAFRDYEPLKFFGGLGLSIFTFGILIGGFVITHYARTGSFSPYIFLAFTSAYLVTLAIIIWVVALLADMLDRIRNNQEKMLYLLKKHHYNDEKVMNNEKRD